MRSPRRRAALVVAAAVTVATGLAVHAAVPGEVGGVLGDALYAALVYLLVAAIGPRLRPVAASAIAILCCAAVELLQLTPLPARLAEAAPPVALVLGTTFQAADLAAYAVGAMLAAVADALSRRAAGSSRGAPTTPSAGAPQPRPPAGTPSR
jgi:hypothetical protein